MHAYLSFLCSLLLWETVVTEELYTNQEEVTFLICCR